MRLLPKAWIAALAALLPASCSNMFETNVTPSAEAGTRSLHSFTAEGIDGQMRDLAAWQGKVVLVVNTASECGFTGQYAGLQALQERFGAQGFDVLAFPSNDFGGQEPGSSADIAEFCSTRYRTTFPIFAKVRVKSGEGQSPIYGWLGAATGKLPGWNFGKYLVGKDGQPRAFWASTTKPEDSEVTAAIEEALAAGT